MKIPNFSFNLRFYGENGEIAIRTLEDLRDNLNISDLLDYYREGVLQRWLCAIGKQEQAANIDAVARLGDGDQEELVRSLLNVLDISLGEEEWRLVSNLITINERRRVANQKSQAIEKGNDTFVDMIAVLTEECDLNRIVEALESVVLHGYAQRCGECIDWLVEKNRMVEVAILSNEPLHRIFRSAKPFTNVHPPEAAKQYCDFLYGSKGREEIELCERRVIAEIGEHGCPTEFWVLKQEYCK